MTEGKTPAGSPIVHPETSRMSTQERGTKALESRPGVVIGTALALRHSRRDGELSELDQLQQHIVGIPKQSEASCTHDIDLLGGRFKNDTLGFETSHELLQVLRA